MTGEKLDAPGGPHVEVTVKSIHGIVWKSDEQYPPALKATVAFKGSDPSMRVTSFTVCGRTGELVVQSNVMELDTEARSRPDGTDAERRLSAAFDDPLNAGLKGLSSRSSSTGSTISSISSQPHLKINVPQCRPSLSLHHANSGCGMADTDSCNDAKDASADEQSGSASEPPIAVEIHVCLQSDHDDVIQEGVAYLLFHGDEHFGSTTLDLPIEFKTQANVNTKVPSLLCQADARVRVQIEVGNDEYPCRKIDLELSDQLDEEKMDGIINQLLQKEALSATRGKATNTNLPENKAGKQKMSSGTYFCNGGREIGQSLQAFLEAFTRCGGRRIRKGRRNYNRFGILRSNSTMATTIATRESLGI